MGRVSGIRRRALIDLDAFAANLAELPQGSMLDARANAYGHGLALIAPVARDLGVTSLHLSNEADAEVARAAGFRDDEILVARRGAPSRGFAYGLDHGGRPVMTLVGEVIAVKRVPARSGVSYGYTYRTDAPTTLALIGLGYADGIPRLASNLAPVRVGSSIRRIAGRVAMDQFVVDCGDDFPEVGSDAIAFGDPGRGDPTAEEWALVTTRTGQDLTAGLGSRIERVAR
jgi:alanine racemase